MSNSNPKDTREEHATPEAQQQQNEQGHTGEGAASAMEQMISQGEKQRRNSPTPDNAGGTHA